MVRAIDADKAIEVAQIKYNDWNLAMAAADGKREINLCFKKQELFKAVKAVIECVPTLTPTREQVEKVWRGCEYCSGDVENRSYLDSKRLYLDENGILTDEIENIDILRLDFCPICGKPLTDKAVEMVMERIETLYD